jgi:hypothetical protein
MRGAIHMSSAPQALSAQAGKTWARERRDADGMQWEL